MGERRVPQGPDVQRTGLSNLGEDQKREKCAKVESFASAKECIGCVHKRYQWAGSKNLSKNLENLLKETARSDIDKIVTLNSADDSVATRASLLGHLKDWCYHASWQDFFDT